MAPKCRGWFGADPKAEKRHTEFGEESGTLELDRSRNTPYIYIADILVPPDKYKIAQIDQTPCLMVSWSVFRVARLAILDHVHRALDEQEELCAHFLGPDFQY